MSAAIQVHAVELLWRQWTALGVAGVTAPSQLGIDLEALIAFTPWVAAVDPRLADEALDWCSQIGKSFISVSRLRQIARIMPSPAIDSENDLRALILDKREVESARLSGKSRSPSLGQPTLLQLRSRYIFGVGARADIIATLVMQGHKVGGERASRIRPTGYTRQTVSTVLDELAHAGILKRIAGASSVSYELTKEAPLRSLLAPLPKLLPRWTERFVIVATILDAWVRFGSRATYAVELAKVLDGTRHVAAAIGQHPPIKGRPANLLKRVDRWAVALLEENTWDDAWYFEGEDILADISDALSDKILESIQYVGQPTGLTELEDFEYRIVDERDGEAEFLVAFTAEHWKADFSFKGHVKGTFHFDSDATDKKMLIESLEVRDARARFDLE